MRHLPFVGFSDFAHWQLSRDLGLEKDATCVTAARLREAAKKGARLLAGCWVERNETS